MSQLTVIIDHRDTDVRMEAGAMRIKCPRQPPERIPLYIVERVIAIGSPMVSCHVWRSLAEHNIPAVLMPSRGNDNPAMIGAPLSSEIFLRVNQHRAFLDPDAAFAIARWIVVEKLSQQAAVIRSIENRKGQSSAVMNIFHRCLLGLNTAKSIESLMGIEGACAAAYFRRLSLWLPKKWKFTGRNRRPPKDPVNALMSLSYVISSGDIRRQIHVSGLDPALGFLNTVQDGRDSLVLDVMEPIRPYIDQFVLKTLLPLLSLTDFRTNEQDGCRLTKRGRQIYYSRFIPWMNRNSTPDGFQSNVKFWIQRLIGHFKTKESDHKF